MSDKQQTMLHESTKSFVIQGAALRKSLYERIKWHTAEKDNCLDKIATYFDENASNDSVSKVAAAAMLSVTLNKNLTVNSMVIKAQLDRAVFLTNEIIDLTCIAHNLIPGDFYRVSLEEAKRYGLL